MNLYQQIILESFLNTIMPINIELIAQAMRAFGGYDMGLATACSVAGCALAGLFMWLLGRICSRSFERTKPERFAHLQQWGNQYGVWLMLFIWLPIGFVVAFAGGLFRMKLSACLPLFVIGAVGFYSYLLML